MFSFFNRDISWLSFNERVLLEAARETVPLMERIRFLSIYSSNLDEFYRVRIPAILALQKIQRWKEGTDIYEQIVDIINGQQEQYGNILNKLLAPRLEAEGYHFINGGAIPSKLAPVIESYFFSQVAGYLHPVVLSENPNFFPRNNCIYLVAVTETVEGMQELVFINIPSDHIPRFLRIPHSGKVYILFLEDVICNNLHYLFKNRTIAGVYNVKITRDAELNLSDDYDGDLTERIEAQLRKRDYGLATRFLYEPGLPFRHLQYIIQWLNLQKAVVVEGGRHHNLKDLASLPVSAPSLCYPVWNALDARVAGASGETLYEIVTKKDSIIHTPYHSYDTVLRFFNEAAIDPSVQEIYTTLYRVASHSKIVHALINAARNGKKVTVIVELKARFDEANNIYWAKQMRADGVKIIYSSNTLKVHAKIALVKRTDAKAPFIGLLATGNLNETTARFYTDHILLTANQKILAEVSALFQFLARRKSPGTEDMIGFEELLVAQFNLHTAFTALIEQEISNARAGLKAEITIKLNNLEEETLISKLYEASNAGVKVKLIVRSICRLAPGIKKQSDNIIVKRIVDRYLEHGRVFVFHNNGEEKIFLGSADWMNRNIYRRIEVCFPLYDEEIKSEIKKIIALQWQDNMQAMEIDERLQNVAPDKGGQALRSQEAIYRYLEEKQERRSMAAPLH
jgi:polyphosphate kinase